MPSCLSPSLPLRPPWRVALVLALSGAGAALAADAPRLLFASGPVEVRRSEGVQPAAVAGTALAPDDHLATGPDARVQLVLADGSRVSVQGSSRVRIAAAAVGGLDFIEGSVRVLPAPGTRDFVLRTRRATARVRGAAFSAAYNADGSVNVASEREPVEVCTPGGCVMAGDDNVRVRADSLRPTRTNARASWR